MVGFWFGGASRLGCCRQASGFNVFSSIPKSFARSTTRTGGGVPMRFSTGYASSRAVNRCEGLELGALGFTSTREKLHGIAANNERQTAAIEYLTTGHDRIAAVEQVLQTVGVGVSGVERAEFVLRSPRHMMLDVRLSVFLRQVVWVQAFEC